MTSIPFIKVQSNHPEWDNKGKMIDSSNGQVGLLTKSTALLSDSLVHYFPYYYMS
ncbi:hypothetical protein [Oceanobacillus halophilus]|uniref:hypothetical protein n=1 Tax=Oceanobacillus halophilus TaxID=930130 RepID=UPI0013146242|nr:hypothetical protein [Oceanobacillus halophilus]